MTYARKKAHEAQNRWLNGPGGHAEALEAVEAVIGEVVAAVRLETLRAVVKDAEMSIGLGGDEQHVMRRIHALIPCTDCGSGEGITCRDDGKRGTYGSHESRVRALRAG